jgi:drug/metabolite transporter (DMT)-like permease
MDRRTATLVGLTAVVMWSTLALFTAATGRVPPFLLNALCFGLSGAVGLAIVRMRTGSLAVLAQPWPVWLLGVGGLFGYHFFYFTALKTAPPVEAGLICYLWPLLIVLFSGLLPGERLRPHHVAGGLLGLAGAALIVTRGGGLDFSSGHALGYGAALAAALIWATYSVASRRFPGAPSDAVFGFCLATAVLSAACHLLLEESVWPATGIEWLAVALLGLFPVGLAFFVWDVGVKRGDIQVLGTASYAAPLLSTLLLVAFGFSEFTWQVGAACLLISGGGLLAAKDMLIRRPAPTPA